LWLAIITGIYDNVQALAIVGYFLLTTHLKTSARKSSKNQLLHLILPETLNETTAEENLTNAFERKKVPNPNRIPSNIFSQGLFAV